jgi:hypothetical protein
MTEIDLHERIARVEANYDNLMLRVTSISEKIDRQTAKLDEIRMDVHQARGAAKTLTIGGHIITGLLSAGAAVGTMMSGLFGRH